MTRRHVTVLSAIAVLSGFAAIAFVESTASAGAGPFVSVPALGSMSALSNPPLLARPDFAARVSSDLQPADGLFYSLGTAGDAWRYGHGVCVVMQSGSGGCFTEFTKPVQLYLTGDQASSGAYSNAWVEGVVPDSIVGITVLMANGVSVPAPISENAFRVPVPVGVGVSGYTVRLRNGQTEADSDPVALPSPATH
jgi:hypothetical protein